MQKGMRNTSSIKPEIHAGFYFVQINNSVSARSICILSSANAVILDPVFVLSKTQF